ncbi:hypothetical protein [Siphonobacter sp. BAB-5405]|uniref:hypothetical protein n=1 Tax=Siphonobacter sp. BAB-5405 TaxID=1864825 RepID=UPI0011AF3645|nr:hypothetical protein [Siphonobacter sp. BAB-5405]
MKKLLLLVLLLSGVMAQAQQFSPVFIPRLTKSQVKQSPVSTGEMLFIDDETGDLTSINSKGEFRVLTKKDVSNLPVTPPLTQVPVITAPADLLNVHASGRLQEGDVLFTLKVPQEATFRYEKVSFGLIGSKPVFVVRTSMADENNYGQPGLKQNEYFANYSYLPFYAYLKDLIDSKVFGLTADIEGKSVPVASGQETDYVFESGRVIYSPKPMLPPTQNVKEETQNHSTIPSPVQTGEISRLQLTKETGLSALKEIPGYTLPAGAINIVSTDLGFEAQVELVRAGKINYIHLGQLADLYGGFYHPEWNQKGIKMERFREILATYHLPENTGVYRMMYSNVFPKGWIDKPGVEKRYQDIYNAVKAYAIDTQKDAGWENHPALLDLDLEEAPYTYIGVKLLCQAIREVKSQYPQVQFQVYCSSHNSLCNTPGGSEKAPFGWLGNYERYEMFRQAGVTVFQGTLPYFHLPSFFWDDPNHESSVIGAGKLYVSQADYAQKSLHPIIAKLGWTDSFFQSLPDGHRPGNIEWLMNIYEGGDDGGERRYYVENGKQVRWSSYNWPEVGNWVLESMAVWGYVTGSYRFGGGLYNWTDSRPRKIGQDYIEAGKWRAFQFNRFWNNPVTVYNIQLEFSLDGGQTWQTDKRPGMKLLDEHQDVRPFVRGAYANGELLIVATAGQPTHLGTAPQEIIVRYLGKQFPLSLKSHTVHSIIVSTLNDVRP